MEGRDRKRGQRGGEMTERTRVKEGLGSGMLGIWLRDVLRSPMVLQKHGDYKRRCWKWRKPTTLFLFQQLR